METAQHRFRLVAITNFKDRGTEGRKGDREGGGAHLLHFSKNEIKDSKEEVGEGRETGRDAAHTHSFFLIRKLRKGGGRGREGGKEGGRESGGKSI